VGRYKRGKVLFIYKIILNFILVITTRLTRKRVVGKTLSRSCSELVLLTRF
jgi:hypothetical protein